MDKSMSYVDENDYKELFHITHEQCKRLEDIITDKDAEIEALKQKVTEQEETIKTMKEAAADMDGLTSFLHGQIVGLKYAIREFCGK